jgi:hypothetical protein
MQPRPCRTSDPPFVTAGASSWSLYNSRRSRHSSEVAWLAEGTVAGRLAEPSARWLSHDFAVVGTRRVNEGRNKGWAREWFTRVECPIGVMGEAVARAGCGAARVATIAAGSSRNRFRVGSAGGARTALRRGTCAWTRRGGLAVAHCNGLGSTIERGSGAETQA